MEHREMLMSEVVFNHVINFVCKHNPGKAVV